MHNERRPVSSELLYDEVYRPPFYIYTGVVLKDKNGEELWNWGDKAPFEIYLPNTPEGEQGAVPHLCQAILLSLGSDGIIIILVTGITMYIHLFPLRTDFVNF